MFSNPIYYIVMTGILIMLIVLLICMIIRRRKEDKVFREYMQKMDELRKLKQDIEARSKQETHPYRTYREKQEAERKAPANPQSAYYTTYNEREEDLVKTPMDEDHYPQIPERKIPDWMIYIAIVVLAIFMYKNGIRIWLI